MEHTVKDSEYKVDYNADFLGLLKDLEGRNFELRTNHNTAYFTFIWFIITITVGLLWFKNDLTIYTKYVFLLTIILFVIWFYLYFQESTIGIKKMEKIYSIIAEAIDNQTNPWDALKKNMKKTCWEKFVWKAYVWLQNIWLLLFLIWIISFIVS